MAASTRNFYALPVVAVSLLAWFTLWFLGNSPYVHYLHHAHRHAAPGSGLWASGAIFVGGWTVMTVAMMLPTSIPLVSIFATVARQRADRALLVALLVSGYLIAWALFGVLAFAGAVAFREAAEEGWLHDNLWALGAALLFLAGLFQFSDLKYRCLDRCRSPLSFVVERWKGHRHRRDALRLGLAHGLFCVGCCWTLMLLMFPFGAGSLAWMLVLGALMAIEKNFRWGRQLGKPLGVVLLVSAVVVAVRH